MKPAITVGVVEFVVVSCYVIIFTFLARELANRTADKPLGQALANVIP